MSSKDNWNLSFRYLVGALCLAALIAFMFYARDAVRNLIIAAFVAYLINPAVVMLASRTRMTRTSAVNVVYFSALILLVGIPATLAPIFYDEVQIVLQDLLNLSNQLSNTLSQPVQFGGQVFHLEEWGRSLSQLQNTILNPLPGEALRLLETTSIGILWSLVILVSVYLFLSEWPRIRTWLLELPPSAYHHDVRELYNRVRRIWMAYLRGQIVLMLIVGVVFTITWLFLGIPGALVLGVIAGFFTLVPDVGPFLAAGLAVGVALLEGSTWIPLDHVWVAGIVFAVYLVLISLKNLFLRPYIMGRSVHMHEGLIFIAIISATILEGILGALLIVPVMASAVVIGSYLQRRVTGLPPFEHDGLTQFIAPPEKIRSTRRARRMEEPASDLTETAEPSQAESESKPNPARKKTKK